MASIRKLYVDLELRAKQFNDAARRAQGTASEINAAFKPTRDLLMGIGRTMTAAVTVPLAALGAAAVKTGTDFETAFAGVRKTVNASEPELAALRQQFRDMAKEIPITAVEFAKIGEAAGQLGIHTEDIAAFSKVMAELGVTTNLTSDQAATATAQFQNIFGAAGKDVDRFGATLVALGNAGASTEQDIVLMGLRIAGAGNLVGLTQAQVLSFASALSSVGIQAEAGGSAISRVFLKINDAVASGGERLDEFARVAGLSSAAFRDAFRSNAADATTTFIEGLARLKESGENVNATLEGLVGKNIILKETLLRAAGAGGELRRQLEVGNEGWRENTALSKEASQRYATTASQLKLLKQALEDVGIELFDTLGPIIRDTGIPLLKQLASGIGTAARWFTQLPEPVKTAALALAAVAAALGPVLLLAAQLIPVFISVSAAIAEAGGLTAALGAAVAFLTGPVGIAVAITAAVAALAYFALQNETTRKVLTDAWESIKVGVGGVLDSLAELWRSITDLGAALWSEHGEMIKSVFSLAYKALAPILKGAFEIVIAALKAALGVLTGAIQVFAGVVTGDWKTFSDGVVKIAQSLWDGVKGVFSAGINAVKAFVEGFTSGVTGLFEKMYDKIVGHSIVPDLMTRIGEEFNDLNALMVNPTRTATAAVTNSFSKMFDSVIGSFTQKVPVVGGLLNSLGTGLAMSGINALRNPSYISTESGARMVKGIGGALGPAIPVAGGTAPAAGGGLFGVSGAQLGAFLSNPITIGVAGAIAAAVAVKHFVGRGRRAADDFGGQTERPFAAQLGDLMAQFNSARSTGSLTRDEAVSTREQLAALVRTYNLQAAEFAAMGKTQAKIVEQANATHAAGFGPGFTRLFDDINQAINQLTKAGVGAGLPQTGLALSASSKFADAVDRLVPALENLADSSSGTGGGSQNAPRITVNIEAPLTVNYGGSEDARDQFEEFMRMVEDNAKGYGVRLTKTIKSIFGGVVTA